MPYVTVGTENRAPIELYYEDHGSGQPVVLIHGYPWTAPRGRSRTAVLLETGKRVITYDRRGFGSQTSRPAVTITTRTPLISALWSRVGPAGCRLVGFSMGTGEVARYISRMGHTGWRRRCSSAHSSPSC